MFSDASVRLDEFGEMVVDKRKGEDERGAGERETLRVRDRAILSINCTVHVLC